MDELAQMRELTPREQRRRVVLPVRLCANLQWSDGCILNISSRGLLVYSHSARVSAGDCVELCRDDQVIVARVVWRTSQRMGLYANHRLPVLGLLSRQHKGAPQLISDVPTLDLAPRKRVQTHDDSRLRSRAMEFASVALIGAILGGGAFSVARQALTAPLARAALVLGAQAPASAEAK